VWKISHPWMCTGRSGDTGIGGPSFSSNRSYPSGLWPTLAADGDDLPMRGDEALQPLLPQVHLLLRLDHVVLVVNKLGDQLKRARALVDRLEQLLARRMPGFDPEPLAVDPHPVRQAVRDVLPPLGMLEDVDLAFPAFHGAGPPISPSAPEPYGRFA